MYSPGWAKPSTNPGPTRRLSPNLSPFLLAWAGKQPSLATHLPSPSHPPSPLLNGPVPGLAEQPVLPALSFLPRSSLHSFLPFSPPFTDRQTPPIIFFFSRGQWSPVRKSSPPLTRCTRVAAAAADQPPSAVDAVFLPRHLHVAARVDQLGDSPRPTVARSPWPSTSSTTAHSRKDVSWPTGMPFQALPCWGTYK